MQEQVYKKPVLDLAKQKQRLVKLWADFKQTTVECGHKAVSRLTDSIFNSTVTAIVLMVYYLK